MANSRHILSVSYDEPLLLTRGLLLEREGYQVTSAVGFNPALSQCERGGFDLFVLGHSIPQHDKHQLIHCFRKNSQAPVLSLQRTGEPIVDGADFHVLPEDPREFLATVARILLRRTNGFKVEN